MDELEALVGQLTAKETARGCAAMRALDTMSMRSDAVYGYLDRFFALLGHANSYVRTRALTLIAANARWDTEGKIANSLNIYLAHLTDPSPITARQCVQLLPRIAEAQPALVGDMLRALHAADISGYRDSMRPLIARDIENAVERIEDMR